MMALEQTSVITGLLTTTSTKLADRYTDALAFGWRRRADRLVNPALDFSDLIAYDDRIRSSIGALVNLGEPAKRHLGDLLNKPMRQAEMFALNCYALAAQDRDLLESAAALCSAIPNLLPARVAALEWAPATPLLETAIDALPTVWRLRMTASRNSDCPGMDKRTLAWLRTQEPTAESVVAALQLLRDLGRADLAPVGLRYLNDAQPEVRLAGAQTLLTLGEPEHQGPASDVLQALATSEHYSVATDALRTLALHTPTQAKGLLAHLVSHSEHRRTYLLTLGWLGEIEYLPELIETLSDRRDGRVAATALALITGSDPARDGWLDTKSEPVQRSAEPGDQLPAHADDATLPSPDVPAFLYMWRHQRARFTTGQRYFAGRPLTLEWLAIVLRTGLLPWRPLAAEHRQRLTKEPLFPTHLPADTQRLRLRELT